jgi:acyl-CoA thioesterase-2
VLGQALHAAHATVEGREVHSLHAYFLRRGDFNAPIVYQVDRSRDGGSFSSRRVVAIQHGAQIFHMSASFQVREQGLEHQVPMPRVPPPESLPDLRELLEAQAQPLPDMVRRFAGRHSPFEFRGVQSLAHADAGAAEPRLDVWFRAVDGVGEDERRHAELLAYVSDYHLIGAALRPHHYFLGSPGIVVASIDHAMWFHRPVRIDDWLLYSIESPTAAGGRGFSRAGIFSRDGVLVASTAQEGLMRETPPRS